MDMSGRGFLIGRLHNFTHDINGRFNPILKGKMEREMEENNFQVHT